MLAPRARPVQLILGFSIALILFVTFRSPSSARHERLSKYPPGSVGYDDDLTGNARANSTLGFGAIIAVSRDSSPRRHALMQAANVTEIDITIPPQPKWTTADVDHFKNDIETHVGTGSVLAWLGHHNALRWFLDTDLESVLILEDDVDWDIHLRSLQIPIVARATRHLLAPASKSKQMDYYWGDPTTWDLLYIGHCGDYFNEIKEGIGPGYQFPTNLTEMPTEIVEDPSTPSVNDLHPFTADLMRALGVSDQKRIVHRSKHPLCTFAYAVTRPAAWKILNVIAPAQEPPPETIKPALAFDVAILKGCRKGFANSAEKVGQGGLRCYTVNPELFHHMPGDSEIAVEEAKVGNMNVGIPPVDVAGADQTKERGESSNINCGFWGGHFAFPDGSKRKLEYLQKYVGREGRCLKPGREKAPSE